MRTFQAYRDNTTFMHFWDAINEGRAAAGQAEALYGNVVALWKLALQPTSAEVERAAERT
jgi:hypothetical protein